MENSLSNPAVEKLERFVIDEDEDDDEDDDDEDEDDDDVDDDEEVEYEDEDEDDDEDDEERINQAADEEAVEKLERFVINDDDDGHLCTVCMDGMNPGERGLQMPCEHVYHEDCIVKWLGASCCCPICRFELPSSDMV